MAQTRRQGATKPPASATARHWPRLRPWVAMRCGGVNSHIGQTGENCRAAKLLRGSMYGLNDQMHTLGVPARACDGSDGHDGHPHIDGGDHGAALRDADTTPGSRRRVAGIRQHLAFIMELKPLPAGPSSASGPTSTSVKNSLIVSWACIPSFSSRRPRLKPGVCVSTSRRLTPLAP